MAPSNRADLIATTIKVLKKKFKPAPPPPERSLLEHWLYGCCLENARYEDADRAFQNIIDAAFDWNEMRVTTVSELAEQMSPLTNPREAAARIKRTLQSVFEWQYTFDLEPLKKQNLGKTVKDMLRLDGTTPFSVSYVVQHALGGHSIPLDRGALDALYIVGVISEQEREKGVAPGLERAISKKHGISDGSLLHQLGAELVKSPYSPPVRELLLAINPDAQPRLPKRQRKKKPSAAVVEEKPPKKKPAEKTKPEKVPAKQSAKKKQSKKKTVAPTKKTKKVAKKKAATTTKKTKKSTSKQLTKRKPR